jgi:hypothetical protein
MPQPKSKSCDDLWAENFRLALLKKGKTPPGTGWLTRAEFAAKTKLGKVRSGKYLGNAVDAGTMERFQGSSKTAGGLVKVQYWYRPIR